MYSPLHNMQILGSNTPLGAKLGLCRSIIYSKLGKHHYKKISVHLGIARLGGGV